MSIYVYLCFFRLFSTMPTAVVRALLAKTLLGFSGEARPDALVEGWTFSGTCSKRSSLSKFSPPREWKRAYPGFLRKVFALIMHVRSNTA